MNESNFRQLFHRAYGDADPPAHLYSQFRTSLRHSVVRQPARLHEGFVVAGALVIAFAALAALLAPRLFPHVLQPVGVSSPSPSPLTPSPDPTACRIPVVVTDNHTRTTRTFAAGFIEVSTGRFTADPNVNFADLPYIAPQGPAVVLELATYNPVVKRWVPSFVLSPDKKSYLYVAQKGGSAEVHVYDLVQQMDRIVWTTAAVIDFPFWREDGIFVSSNLYARDKQSFWRIDPVSGKVTVIDGAVFTPSKPFMSVPGAHGFSSGPDPERMLYTNGGRDPGTRYEDFVIINGKRVDIYSGVNGDQMDFDPFNVWFDGSRLWFSNFDSKILWTWTAATGLVRYPIQIPNATGDPMHPVTYRVAGPCIT
jgi:hypothetical protein